MAVTIAIARLLMVCIFLFIYRPKFVHFVTIPLNMILFFMFFAQFKLPGSYIEDTFVRLGPFFFPTNWSCLPLGILVLVYIVMGKINKFKVWGFATAVIITMLWGAVSVCLEYNYCLYEYCNNMTLCSI